ncbi:MAG: DUF1631 family protein [Gammaproteobacteria bacterium]
MTIRMSSESATEQNFNNVLNPWKKETISFLVTCLREMFKSADQVLLEFADNAQNTQVQTHFFEAMRELWLKQDNVITIFSDGLDKNLLSFNNQNKLKNSIDDPLSLVDKDSFERNLALQTIANQAEKKNYSTLYELSQRLGVLNHGKALKFEQIPAGPGMLADIFERCVEVIFIEKEVRLVLYTLFDRYVISKAIKNYEDLNKRLIDAGILPDLKPQFKKQESKETKPAAADKISESEEVSHKVDASPTQIASQAFDQIKDILAQQRAAKMVRKQQQNRASNQPYRATGNHSVQPASSQEVVTAISNHAVVDQAPLPDVGIRDAAVKRVQVDADLIVNINETLKKQRELIKKLVGQERIPAEDEDVIDIVGMVFEIMLNDKALCNEVKTLLSHLHTPYLKIAVADPSFLINHEHPARRLFELMIATGRDWVDASDLTKGIYPQIQLTVNTILENPKYDEKVFNKLSAHLTEANAHMSDRQKLSEDRTIEVEKGRAKLNQAKDIAIKNTHQLLVNRILIADANDFLNGPWLDYLTLVLLRSDFNYNSDSWQQALALCQKIIDYSLSSEDANFSAPSQLDVAALSTEMQEVLGSLIPHYQSEIDRFLEALTDSEKRGSTYSIEPELESAEEEAFSDKELAAEISKLKNLRSGTWFGLTSETGEAIRVKMSWFNPVTANFLFVDQKGVKAAVRSLKELASEVADGRALIIEQTSEPFFDRSFKAIRNLLEKAIH